MTVPVPGPPRRPAESDPDVAASVQEAMSALDGIEERPLAEHVEVFERVHAVLGDALASGSE